MNEQIKKFLTQIRRNGEDSGRFPCGKEDVIIASTARSNSSGFIGFVSDPRRTNVALTRQRHCSWILQNIRALSPLARLWNNHQHIRPKCWVNSRGWIF